MKSPTPHFGFRLCFGLFLLLRIPAGSCDESQSIVNGKKSLHKVDDKFISISVDPAILFSGIKLSSTSLKLATSLSPIYLRIAGPSTAFLSYNDDDSKSTDVITESTRNIVFGPTKWWALNEWVRAANFTPVYAINDAERVNEDWDPKSTLSLLEISSKMNVNCYWQLGYDARGKTQHGYKDDLKTLKHILDAFPGSKGTWKTVGSDLSEFSSVTERQIDELEADAVMWEPETMGRDAMHRLLTTRYSKTPEVWVSAPKSGPIVSFDSALDWGVQIGEAAKNGFSVIFRQPRLQELFSDTPAYWISILHKHLMGRNVLEVKQTSLTPSKAHVYAHCSRNQNSYSVRGAMTVMMVNNQTQEHTSSLLVAGTQMKNLEVRSYILTSPRDEDSMETLLNGEVISMQNLTQNRFDFKPKLRRAKAMTHLSLTIPGKSIGFFVLPGARIPVCVEEEDETSLILEEMDNAQGIDFPEEEKSSESIFSRINTGKPVAKLSDLYHRIEEEIEEDEKYYKRIQLKPLIKADDWKQSLLERVKESKAKTDEGGKLMLNKLDLKNVELNHLKKLDLNKLDLNKLDLNKLDLNKMDLKKVDLKNLLRKEESPKTKDLDLSSSEILRVLSDRAKARIGFNSPDFDELLEKVKSKIRARRSARGGRGRGGGRRPRRDINMALLNLKTGNDNKKDVKMKSKFNYDKKEATIRQPGASSEEYEDDQVEETGQRKPEKIFAGFASVEDDDLPDMQKVLPGLPMKPTKETSIKDFFSPELFSLDNKKDLFAFDSRKSKPELFFDSPKAKSSADLFSKSSDLFGLEPQTFSKISLSNLPIFHQKPSTSTAKTPKRKNFVDFVKEDQSEEKLEDLDELEDALNSYHGFHEAFGDDVSVVKGKDGYNDDLLDNKDEVERTIKKLENFFNADESYESNFGRYRRDVSRYTEEDVDFYTKLMKGNIQHMRNSIRERKRQDAFKKFSGGDFFKSLLPQSTLLRSNLNKIDKDVAKPSPAILQDHQVRFLKNRLAHKKKLEELQSRLPKLDIAARFRRTRNAEDDDVYVPSKANFSNALLKSYESKLKKMREWRDEDILLLPKPKKPISINFENLEEKDIPLARNRIRVNKRLPRGTGYDSLENTIDGFVNYIKKEADLEEATSGEYSLILPTKDALSLKQKNGSTDIKIHTENNSNNNNDKGVEAFTCLATDLTTTTTENAVTVGNDEDGDETTIYEEDDMEVLEIVKKPLKMRVSIDDGSVDVQFFNRMLDKIKDLFGQMNTSFSNFFE